MPVVWCIILYYMAGICLLVFVAPVARQSNAVGHLLPDMHLRYVVLMMFVWPLCYFTYKAYAEKLEEIRNVIHAKYGSDSEQSPQGSVRSAVQDNLG